MRIGILSDTHGNVRRTLRAIAALKPFAPVHIIHCGDIGSQAVLDELAAGFADPPVPITCVLGNVDEWEQALSAPLPHLKIRGGFADVEIDGRRIAVTHGHRALSLDEAIASQRYDYVFTGHTNQRADELDRRTRA